MLDKYKEEISRIRKRWAKIATTGKEKLDIIGYTHVTCLFLMQKFRRLLHYQNNLLGLEVYKVWHDPDKIIFNYLLIICLKVKKVYFAKVKTLKYHLIKLNTQSIYGRWSTKIVTLKNQAIKNLNQVFKS